MADVERESINFRLPKTLAQSLRATARERKTTATDLVIQGLYHVLEPTPDSSQSVETRLKTIEQEILRLQENVGNQPEAKSTNVESKLDELSRQLTRFEGALIQIQNSIKASRSRGKSSGYSYQNSAPVRLQPRNEEELATRLGTSSSYIQEKRAALSQKDFERWTQDRDLGNRAWRFNEKDGLYHPIY